jgi:hypothetical protein
VFGLLILTYGAGFKYKEGVFNSFTVVIPATGSSPAQALSRNDRQGYPPKVGALGEAFAILTGQALVEMQRDC